ncbi:hypothetical protein MARPO_0032s0103, partial [Marchantia polymorpha]
VSEAETRFCQKFVRSRGYTCKEYEIKSADGYGLLLQRVRAISNASLAHIRGPSVVVEHFDQSAQAPTAASSTAELGVSNSRNISAHASIGDLPFSPPVAQEQISEPQAAPRSPAVPASEALRTPRAYESTTFPGSATIAQAESPNPKPPISVIPTPSVPAWSSDSDHSPATPPQSIDKDTVSAPGHGPADSDESRGPSPVFSPPVPQSVPLRRKVPPHEVPLQPSPLPLGRVVSNSSAVRKHEGNAVLLMHAGMLNGDSWFIKVHEDGALLPFVLADDGFDVWIAHERATYWSHGHSHLKSKDPAYWNWTWDQHVQYDVPRMLQFVNSKTRSKVHYIGVSQSATVGAAAATMPQSTSFLQSLTLIGPTIYRGGTPSLRMRAWAGFLGTLMDGSANGSRVGPFNFFREFRMQSLPLKAGPISAFLTSISGADCCLNEATVLVDNGWDGRTSFKNLRHFVQGLVRNTFQQFDYGSARRNVEAYGGRMAPPPYEPARIPSHVPVCIVYGGQDLYATPSGVMDFADQLVRRPTMVFLPFYAHLDLFFSTRRASDVFTPIQSFLAHHPFTAAGPDIPPPETMIPVSVPRTTGLSEPDPAKVPVPRVDLPFAP